MNFDRFGFKAIGKSTEDWAFARMAASGFGCFGIRWSDGIHEDYDGCHIYPETICQCTGLKDSEGNLIYENDILSVEKPGEEPETATIIFSESDNSMIVKMRGVKFYWLSRFFWRARWDNWKIKVIGNKFDKEKENEMKDEYNDKEKKRLLEMLNNVWDDFDQSYDEAVEALDKVKDLEYRLSGIVEAWRNSRVHMTNLYDYLGLTEDKDAK